MTDAIRSKSSSYDPISSKDHEDDARQMSRKPELASRAPKDCEVDPDKDICSSYRPPLPASALKSSGKPENKTEPKPQPKSEGKSESKPGGLLSVEPGKVHAGRDEEALAGVKVTAEGPTVRVGDTTAAFGKVDAQVGAPYLRMESSSTEVEQHLPLGMTYTQKGPSAEVALGPKVGKEAVSVGAMVAASEASQKLTVTPLPLLAAKHGLFGSTLKAAAQHLDVKNSMASDKGVSVGFVAGAERAKDGAITMGGKVAVHELTLESKVVIKP